MNLVATFTLLLLVGGAIVLMALLLRSQIYEDGKFSSISIEALAQNILCVAMYFFFFNFCHLVDCGVQEWGAWTVCSATCGGGRKNRTRNEKHHKSWSSCDFKYQFNTGQRWRMPRTMESNAQQQGYWTLRKPTPAIGCSKKHESKKVTCHTFSESMQNIRNFL